VYFYHILFRVDQDTTKTRMLHYDWRMRVNLWNTGNREIFSGDIWKVRYTNQIRTRYRNRRTISATQLQPSKSLCYIGYTSPRSDVPSCVLMQETATCNIFYDGTSFQHLATVLISVFTLCYGPGLLFRGPSCVYSIDYWTQHVCVVWKLKTKL